MIAPLSFAPRMLPRLAFAAVLASGAGAAGAQGFRAAGYAPSYGDPVGYGFADEAVRGAYVGAPLTRFPSPNAIVPAPWSYGTYGVPTLSGIRPPPVAPPRLTVIDAGAPPVRRAGPRILSRDGGGAWTRAEPASQGRDGMQVVEVGRR